MIPDIIFRRLPPKLVEIFRPRVDGYRLGTAEGLLLSAHEARRRQYRAEIVLHHLLAEANDETVVLGIVDVDLYVPDLNFVFGLSQRYGRAALVSIRRLDPVFYGQPPNQEILWNRALKEAVHELGHTFGLNHCWNSKCVMSFSNSIMEVDGKSPNFCRRCRSSLFGSF